MALYVNGKQISGGGGSNSVELTYAEYQALTPEQQLDGTEYFITDINGDGQQFQPICYSESEREIGVWTDGKPLYEKTVTFANPSGRQDFVAHGIADVDRIFVSDWHARREAYGESVQGFEGTDSGYWASVFDVNPTGVSWRIGASWGCDSVVITFRYTKTTDQAGSGTWTPQGVPAHHYSNDEQVVGTWVDGKTLYEKTWYFQDNMVSIGTDWTSLNISVSDLNIGEIVDHRAQSYSSQSVSIGVWNDSGTLKGIYWQNGLNVGSITIQYTKSST